jgi:phosphate transport system substrate-binding protein
MKKFLGFATVVLGAVSLVANLVGAQNKVVIEGSTTVLPIAQKAAEVFMQKNSGINLSVRGGGSGVGIASLLDKTCQIANSSRPIRGTELEKGLANGVNVKTNIVAMDGIVPIVHKNNSLSNITKDQLKAIYTGKISNWSQLGGPDSKIVVVSRDSSSGTFEAWGTLVLDTQRVRKDALMQASNQAVASTVAKTPGGIGYVGLGFLSDEVKALTVNGVAGNKQTVLSGKFPVNRPLYMYTDGEPKGTVKQFIDFILSVEGQKLVEEVGYVALK